MVQVWRPEQAAFNPLYTVKTIKFGGGNVMAWACMSWHGVGPIVRIRGKMDQFVYKDILEQHMEPYADGNMPMTYTFQQDNDPKHTSRLVKQWLSDNIVRVMEWPPQSPDLNPIEHLWGDVKNVIDKKKFGTFDELWAGVEEAWRNISVARCQRLVESMGRRCSDVLKNKGYPTKY